MEMSFMVCSSSVRGLHGSLRCDRYIHSKLTTGVIRHPRHEALPVVFVSDHITRGLCLRAARLFAVLDGNARVGVPGVAICQSIAGDRSDSGGNRGCRDLAVALTHEASEQSAGDAAEERTAVRVLLRLHLLLVLCP